MTDKPTIYEALSRVMAAVQAVKKADRNQEQNYNFRGIDAVVNAVGPALREHGVLVTPELLEVGYRDVLTSRGKPSRECTVRVRYRFHGPAGDHLDVVVPGESMDFGDKGAAKAMSVAFRIALLQALAIPTDEPEHDPDAHSYERAAPPSPRAVELLAEIGAAETAEALRAAWVAAQDAGKAGQATAGEVAQLKAHITRRGEELAKQTQPVEPVRAGRVTHARCGTDHLPDEPCPRSGVCEPDAGFCTVSGHDHPAEQPAEDRTAEQPDQTAEQPAMEADWPEPARPGNPT